MAANTGPDVNTYQIPEVALGDTFNTWRDITNTSVYKLNKLKFYEGISSGSISVTTSTGGTASIALLETISTGHTFSGNINFGGVVTFNASTVTMNANTVTIDDYNIVLGDTAGASDTNINTAGGGGIILNRTSGASAEWLWQPNQIHGVTGVWRANSHIGFSGATSGLYPADGGTLPVHGLAIRLDGGATTDHGFAVSLTNSGVAGATSNRAIQFSRYSPTGATVFMEVLNGTTYGAQPVVSIYGGVNKKIVSQAHSFSFGTPLYLYNTTYTAAQASSSITAEVVGLVSRIIDSNNFEITFLGEIFGNFSNVTEDGSALNPGSVYYLSPFTAGKISTSSPIAPSQVHKALFIATSSTSAVVYPFTGGVLSSPTNITSTTSVGTNISQYNQFSVGDFVRWKFGSTTLTYGNTSGTYTQGVYVKSQANSDVEAELAGMVINTGTETGSVGGKPIYTSFDLLMDGFFSGLSLPSNYGSVNSGGVYFLARDAAGTSNCFEGNTACFTTGAPTIAGSIRKPLFMCTTDNESQFSGYLFSYRGDSIDPTGLSASVPLESLLIQNLGSCGSVQDLQFGVRDGAGTAGGNKVMRFPGSRPGSVDIGWGAIANSAGATLDVRGPIRAGTTTATQGSDIIVSRYNEASSPYGYPETLNVFGTQYSSGNSVISFGARPAGIAGDAHRYTSTTSSSVLRSALEVGTTNGNAGLILRSNSTASSTAIGTAVTMTNTLWANPAEMVYSGGTASFFSAMNIGTTQDRASLQTHKPRLFIQGDSNTVSRPQVYMITTDGNFLLMNSSGLGGDYNPINAYNSGSYLVFGNSSGANAGRTFAIAPWATQSTGLVMSYSGTTFNVGINTATPTVALDVNGSIKGTTSGFAAGNICVKPSGSPTALVSNPANEAGNPNPLVGQPFVISISAIGASVVGRTGQTWLCIVKGSAATKDMGILIVTAPTAADDVRANSLLQSTATGDNMDIVGWRIA